MLDQSPQRRMGKAFNAAVCFEHVWRGLFWQQACAGQHRQQRHSEASPLTSGGCVTLAQAWIIVQT